MDRLSKLKGCTLLEDGISQLRERIVEAKASRLYGEFNIRCVVVNNSSEP